MKFDLAEKNHIVLRFCNGKSFEIELNCEFTKNNVEIISKLIRGDKI